MHDRRLPENDFREARQEVLASWPTGAGVDIEEAMRYQRAMPAPRRFAEALAASRGKLLVQPRASRHELAGLHNDALKLRLTTPPVEGRANQAVVAFLATLPEHKTIVLPVVPTAENLAAEAFRILDAAYLDTYGNQLRLQRVRLYETPNNWADAER